MGDYKVGPGKPPLHGRIKKGEVRNPEGARVHKAERLRITFKKMSRKQLEKVGSLVLLGTQESVEELEQNKNQPLILRWAAKFVLDGYKTGHLGTFEVILDRFVGKIPTLIEATGKDGAPLQTTCLPGTVLILPQKDMHDDSKAIESGDSKKILE